VEASFFASNVLKLVHGGWLPIVVGGILFYGMTTWKIGREHIRRRLQSTMQFDQFVASIELSGLLADENWPHCVRGTAVFLASSPVGTPIALLNNLKHNRVIHERTTFFLCRETLIPSSGKALSLLRRTVFRLMSRNARKCGGLLPAPKRSDRRNWLSS
jgi:KUP system potassium uptake protein